MMIIMVMMMMMVTIVMWRMGRLEMMCGSCLRQCALAENASTVWEPRLSDLHDDEEDDDDFDDDDGDDDDDDDINNVQRR